MESCHVPAIVARTLAARGIATVEEARRFLTPSLERATSTWTACPRPVC